MYAGSHSHLVVEHLGFTRLGFRDQGLVQNVENVLADLLQFQLDLVAVIADGPNVLIGSLCLFLLLNRGDDTPRGATCANDVLVGDREQITLVDRQFSANLCDDAVLGTSRAFQNRELQRCRSPTYLRNFLIVLLAEVASNRDVFPLTFMYLTISAGKRDSQSPRPRGRRPTFVTYHHSAQPARKDEQERFCLKQVRV